jgi:hypothetical protein
LLFRRHPIEKLGRYRGSSNGSDACQLANCGGQCCGCTISYDHHVFRKFEALNTNSNSVCRSTGYEFIGTLFV